MAEILQPQLDHVALFRLSLPRSPEGRVHGEPAAEDLAQTPLCSPLSYSKEEDREMVSAFIPVLYYGALSTAKYAALYDKHNSQDSPQLTCPLV